MQEARKFIKSLLQKHNERGCTVTCVITNSDQLHSLFITHCKNAQHYAPTVKEYNIDTIPALEFLECMDALFAQYGGHRKLDTSDDNQQTRVVQFVARNDKTVALRLNAAARHVYAQARSVLCALSKQ